MVSREGYKLRVTPQSRGRRGDKGEIQWVDDPFWIREGAIEDILIKKWHCLPSSVGGKGVGTKEDDWKEAWLLALTQRDPRKALHEAIQLREEKRPSDTAFDVEKIGGESPSNVFMHGKGSQKRAMRLVQYRYDDEWWWHVDMGPPVPTS